MHVHATIRLLFSYNYGISLKQPLVAIWVYTVHLFFSDVVDMDPHSLVPPYHEEEEVSRIAIKCPGNPKSLCVHCTLSPNHTLGLPYYPAILS